MPLIAINYNSKVFKTAKSEKNKLNEIKEIITLKFPENQKESQEVNMSTEDMNTLIPVASNESEKTLLKHTVCNAYNLSKRQAKTLYAISRVRQRAEKVSKAASKIAEIKSKHDFLAQLEQRLYLFALGLNVGDYIPELSSDSESEISEVELSSDDDDESSPTFAAVKQDIEHVVNSFIEPERVKDNLDKKKSGESHCDTNFSSNYVHTAWAKLKSVSFNWFAFVAVLQPEFASAGYDMSFLDRYVTDFFEHIRNFNLPEEEIQLIENSRNAYLSSQVVTESEYMNCFASASDSSSDEVEFESNDTEHTEVQPLSNYASPVA